jgi:hypothetical protein
MTNDPGKHEIAKRAASATIATVFYVPDTMARFQALLEEAAYRAITDYEALRETSGEGSLTAERLAFEAGEVAYRRIPSGPPAAREEALAREFAAYVQKAGQ